MKKLCENKFYVTIKNLFKKFKNSRVVFAIIGIAALIWFLIRVIPKPSRALYPCQRAAFPLASAFIIWLIGLSGTILSFKNAKKAIGNSRPLLGSILIVAAIISIEVMQFGGLLKETSAKTFAKQESLLIEENADTNIVNPKAVVSIIRSTKAKAEDIDSAEICSMVRQAVEAAGGFDTLIHDTDVVVLKPNLIAVAQLSDDYLPIPGKVLSRNVNSVTTDYRVIQAVVNLVREKNPNGKIYIMEGSGIGKTRENMQAMGWLNIKGVDQFIFLDENCGAWNDKTATELVKVSLPSGKALYKAANNVYYLNKIYYEADVLISLPILKTHCNSAVTGAVKNVGIGATPINIYGAGSDRHWRVDKIDHEYNSNNYLNLHNWIHDFYMCRPVDYAIMDGLTGMQNGPTPVASDPTSLRKKNTRCILASKDPIALDAIESLIVQVDPSKVSHLATLNNDKLGCADVRLISIKGININKVKDVYANVGNYASFDDFIPPVVSVKSYSFSSDTLKLALNAPVDLVRVDISVNGIELNKMAIKKFDNIVFKMGTVISDPSKIVITAYDHYLNSYSIYLNGNPANMRSKLKIEEMVSVYPNPFKDYITIGCNNLTEESYLSVFDFSGKKVYSCSLTQSKRIDLSKLRKGEYMLVVQNNKIKEHAKIVKE